jgi:hypothetical protein
MNLRKTTLLSMSLSLALYAGCGSDPAVSNPGEVGESGGTANGGTSGVTGGTSSGGTVQVSVGGDGSEDLTPVDPGAACATDNQKAEPLPLDMGLLVDTSYSMDFEGKWPQVSNALLTFAAEPAFADLGVCLQFFPLRKQCSLEDYGSPAVPLQKLSKGEPALREAITNQRMFGGTPLVQVLQGMGGYLKAKATDGVPDQTCAAGVSDPPNSLENAAAVASDLSSSSPAIPVFVIGVGEELTALQAIAEAGGTDEAILVSTSGNVQKSLFEALENIRRRSLSCEYPIPAPESGEIDFANVNVRYTEEDDDAETLLFVGEEDDCELADDGGWYYDDADSPEKIVLCPETCERVKESASAKIEALFGCKRLDVPR